MNLYHNLVNNLVAAIIAKPTRHNSKIHGDLLQVAKVLCILVKYSDAQAVSNIIRAPNNETIIINVKKVNDLIDDNKSSNWIDLKNNIDGFYLGSRFGINNQEIKRTFTNRCDLQCYYSFKQDCLFVFLKDVIDRLKSDGNVKTFFDLVTFVHPTHNIHQTAFDTYFTRQIQQMLRE